MMLPLPFGSWPDPSCAALLAGVVVPHQSPPQVRIASPFPHRYQLAPVGRATRWFTELGLTKRLHSGDRDFDATWSVETDDVEFGQALVRLPEVRDAVAALAELGACRIAQGRKHLTVVLGQQEKARLKEPARKAAVEAALQRLAGQGVDLAATHHFPQRRGRVRLFIALVAAAAALLVLGISFCAFWAGDLVDGEAVVLGLRSLVAGVPIGLAVLAAATAPLARRSTSHKEFGALALLLLPAMLALCFAGALAANRFLDPGPAVQHRTPVVALHERRNKKKVTGYWAVVPDWRVAAGSESGRTRRISFGTRTGAEIVPGRTELLLHLSPGRLGAERLLMTVVETPPEH